MIFRLTWQLHITKCFLILIFIAADYRLSFSQPHLVIDTLMNNLKAKTRDTNKINVLDALINGKWLTVQDSTTKEYAVKALTLAEKMDFPEGKAYSNFHIALNYSYQGNHPEALKYFEAALRISKEFGFKREMAVFLSSIGYEHWRMGKYTEALKYYAPALKLSEENGDKHLMGDTYFKIGYVYRNIGDYTAALKNTLSCLKLAEEAEDKGLIGKAIDGMGLIYLELGNYQEALKNFEAGIKIWQEMRPNEVFGSYNRLGRVYTRLGNYPEALKNFLLALNFFKNQGDKYSTAVTYNNIGDLYSYQSNYQEALKNYLAGLKLNKEIGEKYRTALNCNHIGKTYIGLKNYPQARKYILDALFMAKETGEKENIKNAYESLSIIDSALGNYKQALTYFKLYSDYKDSILNEVNSKQLAQLKEQYESDKKDKEIELLNKGTINKDLQLKKQKQVKSYFITGMILFAILSFLIYRNYHVRQKLKLLTLRNKIASDLHDDVGSTLSSISIFSQMALEESKEVKPMLQTIGESSRKMLDAMADIVWTIHPENDQFEKIIMRMRSFAYELLGAKQIEFRFVADKNISNIKLPMEARRNLYLIFKEATNNLVKYANANKAMFSIKEMGDKLVMMITDNGKGFDIKKETQGNGLKNMKKRAIEMGANLQIDSIPGSGTTIQLEMAV